MDWQILGTILGAVFGGQGLIELLKYFKNRKAESRIAESNADSAEFTTLSQTNLFLQQQLQEKEERFAQQTTVLRAHVTEVIQLTKEKAEVELAYARYKADVELELERVRCNDHVCPWRRPPNALTGPKPGMEKDEYHKNRQDENN